MMKTSDLQLWSQIFLNFILFFVEQYKSIPDEKKWLKSAILGAMNKFVRIMQDVIPVQFASKAAINECKKIGVNIFDLKSTNKNACILGRDEKGKSLLIAEHMIPVNQLIKSLIQCNNKEDMKKVISEYPGICWVLREEDDRLNKKGYKNYRPSGGRAEYQECRIPVVESPYYKK